MKLTNTQNMKAKSGMTLLELTVVILVLLSLISILFVGARAWKAGSDRAGCILNIRNVQQAVRGEANMKQLAIGDACLNNLIWGVNDTVYMKPPSCPSLPVPAVGATNYVNFLAVVPATGTLYLTCVLAADPTLHVPAAYTDW
jgi:prepilin-type N-terminal cleavage/methylation domain-containing protein